MFRRSGGFFMDVSLKWWSFHGFFIEVVIFRRFVVEVVIFSGICHPNCGLFRGFVVEVVICSWIFRRIGGSFIDFSGN